MRLENLSQTQRKLKNRNGSYHDYELSSPDPWSKNLKDSKVQNDSGATMKYQVENSMAGPM